MAQIPTIPGTEMIQTPVGQVKRDPSAKIMLGRSVSQLGQGFEQVGQVFQELQDKMNLAADGAALTKRQTLMTRSEGELMAKLAQNQDPDPQKTWPAMHDAMVKEVQNKSLTDPQLGSISPRAKRQLNMDLSSWAQTGSTKVMLDATKKKVALDTKDYNEAIDEFVKNLRPDLAISKITEMREHNLIGDGDMKKRINDANNQVSVFGVDRKINDDAIGAYKSIQDGTMFKKGGPGEYLNEAQKKTATIAARTKSLSSQSDFEQHAANQLAVKPDHTFDDKWFKKYKENGQLSEEGEATIRMAMKRYADEDKKAVSVAEHDEMYSATLEVYEHLREQKTVTPEQEKKLRDVANKWTNPKLIETYLKTVDGLIKSIRNKAATEDRPEVTTALNQMLEDRNNESTFLPAAVVVAEGTFHFFKPNDANTLSYVHIPGGVKALEKAPTGKNDSITDSEIEARYGTGVKRVDLIEAEKKHFAVQFDKYRTWLKSDEGQRSSAEKKDDYRRKLEAPFVMQAIVERVRTLMSPKTILKYQPNAEAINKLLENPDTAKQFDLIYGDGISAAYLSGLR